MRKSLAAFFCLSFSLLLAVSALLWRYYLFVPLSVPEMGVYYTIEKGDNLKVIAEDLMQLHIIPSSFYLRLLFRLTQSDTQLKTGTYLLTPHLEVVDLLSALVEGHVSYQPFQFISGWTINDVYNTLTESGWLSHQIKPHKKKIYPKANLWDIVNKAFYFQEKISHYSLEGLILPDTYFVEKNTLDKDVLEKAANAQLNFLKPLWNKRSNHAIKTPYEAVILASILEKETSIDIERPQIAGVLVNRLNKNMPLQVDPTIIYALGDSYTGRLHKKDLRLKSAYNTYLNRGLPPTPIAIPSRQSLVAALNPAKTTALYFVATGEGGHVFSTTLEQHRVAVKQYWRKQKP